MKNDKLEWIRGDGAVIVDALDASVRPLLVRWVRVRQCTAGQVLWVFILATDELFRGQGLPVPKRKPPPDGDLFEGGASTRFGNRLAEEILSEVLKVLEAHAGVSGSLQYLAVRFFRVKLSVGVALYGPAYLEGTNGGRVERACETAPGRGADLAPVVPYAASSRGLEQPLLHLRQAGQAHREGPDRFFRNGNDRLPE